MQARVNARVRALHTSPGTPPLDVYIGGAPAMSGLAYGEVSDYAEVPPGRYQVQFFAAGTEGGFAPLVEERLEELEPGEDNTVVAVGEAQDIGMLLLHDDSPLPAPDEAMVRVVHASPDAPALDVAFRRGRPLFRQVPFARATPFEALQAGTVNVELWPSGPGELILAMPEGTLVGGRRYTFVALGLLRGTPAFELMPIVEPVEVCAPR